MNLLLDEMHAPAVADRLRDDSVSIVAVAAEPQLRGISDEDLLSYAAVEGYAVVTENAADFMTLATRWAGENRQHAGLVLTNPKRFNRAAMEYPGNLIAALRDFAVEPPVTGDSWIWWL